ncbi:MAG: response regulator [Trichocoleus desertorum ATA4-8-CV12]|nr:response regulator [Trichocoleus desertorum ATA4-8-CV12]
MINDIQRDLQAQASIIAEQTARGIQAVDIVLGNLADRISNEPELLQDRDKLGELLTHQAEGLVQTEGLVVVDARGGPLATSSELRELPPGEIISNQSVFQSLKLSAVPKLWVGNVTRGSINSAMTFAMGRRISALTNDFAGVVSAHGKVEYFQRFYRDSFQDKPIRISLMHRDGWLLARHPPANEMLGHRLEVLATLLPTESTITSTVARLPSPVDGADHFVALQVVPEYPLVIAVSLEASTALSDWRDHAWTTLFRTGILCALAAMLLWMVSRQINALQTARNSLQVSDERYAIAMEGSRGGHWVYDTKSDILYSSEAVNKLFGLNAQARSMPRLAYYALLPIHPDDRKNLIENSNAVIKGEADRLEQEYRIELSDGEHWILTRAQRFQSSEAGGIQVAGVSVDITERKQLEAERERLSEELRRAQRMEAIGTLAGGIAHDFNNILASILGHGELARRRLDQTSPEYRHIDTCIRAGQRAKSLVERILVFARGGVSEKSIVDVEAAIHEVLESLEHRISSIISLEVSLQSDGFSVLCDPIQLHQVILNLCSNALQAIEEKGRLAVRLRHENFSQEIHTLTGTVVPGDYLCLEVLDNGIGMDKSVQERIFDPFFSTRGTGLGTGLGLSLVHGIVTDMGGGIQVESEVGIGSRFIVILPAIKICATVMEPSEERDRLNCHGEGQVVLVVDDEASLVSLMEEELAIYGFEPMGCTQPNEALNLLRENPMRFDLVITDESMPQMRGAELTRHARSIRENIPIILVSGFLTPKIVQEAKVCGVNLVLEKPLSVGQLGRAVFQVITSTPATGKYLEKLT